MGFPNFRQKYLSEPLTTPQHFVRRLKKRADIFTVPKSVIIIYQPPFLSRILAELKTEKAAFAGRVNLIGATQNRVAVAGNFGFGAPALAARLEELIALGVKRFVSLGGAGTLHNGLKIGDAVLCEKAIRDEGLSHHYVKSAKYAYPSKELNGKIIDSFKNSGVPLQRGPTWTTDAVYQETKAEIIKYRQEGVATVDMEASALFTVANYRKVNASAVFVITDSLAGPQWSPEFHSKAVSQSMERAFRCVLKALAP